MIELKWKQSEKEYTNGKDLYCGAWNVGGAYWDGITRSKEKYFALLKLPGIISRSRVNFASEKEAMDWAEKSVLYWFKKAIDKVV